MVHVYIIEIDLTSVQSIERALQLGPFFYLFNLIEVLVTAHATRVVVSEEFFPTPTPTSTLPIQNFPTPKKN